MKQSLSYKPVQLEPTSPSEMPTAPAPGINGQAGRHFICLLIISRVGLSAGFVQLDQAVG